MAYYSFIGDDYHAQFFGVKAGVYEVEYKKVRYVYKFLSKSKKAKVRYRHIFFFKSKKIHSAYLPSMSARSTKTLSKLPKHVYRSRKAAEKACLEAQIRWRRRNIKECEEQAKLYENHMKREQARAEEEKIELKKLLNKR